MKKKSDPRHKVRVEAVKTLFENSFRQDSQIPKGSVVFEVLKNSKEIDKIIEKSAPAWPLNQIAPIDLAILRLAIFELLYKKGQVPYKVIVDEAVEIAKQYAGDSSPSFINGVLGTVIKENKI